MYDYYERKVKLSSVISELQKIYEEHGDLDCFGDYDGRACPLDVGVGNATNYQTYKEDVYGVHFT